MNLARAYHFKYTTLQLSSACILASAKADSVSCMISSAVPDLASLVNKEYVALHPLQILHLLTFLLSFRLESGFGSHVVICCFPKLIL